MTLPSWSKATLLLLVTLGIGVALGVSYERRRGTTHEMAGPHHMIESLTAQLSLDAAQVKDVAAILERRQATVDSTWHAMRPHVMATMDSTLREIAAVLRPDQAERLRAMLGRHHPGALP